MRIPEHPLRWTALKLLAAHGDGTDLPQLISGLEWLDGSPSELCGYDTLAAGIARIGGPEATALLPRIRSLWLSPHSYERAAYLYALIRLDPTGLPRQPYEGLWDCQADVQRLAAEHAPLSSPTRQRLHYLRENPIETNKVRAIGGTQVLKTPEGDLVYDVHGPLPMTDGHPPLFMIGQPMAAGGFGTLAWHFAGRTVIT